MVRLLEECTQSECAQGHALFCKASAAACFMVLENAGVEFSFCHAAFDKDTAVRQSRLAALHS